jgi:hypothetical protein
MGLLDDLAVVEGRDYGSNAVDRMLDAMDDEYRAAVVAALKGPMGHAELARKLNKWGHLTDVSDPASRVADWRRRRVDAS